MHAAPWMQTVQIMYCCAAAPSFQTLAFAASPGLNLLMVLFLHVQIVFVDVLFLVLWFAFVLCSPHYLKMARFSFLSIFLKLSRVLLNFILIVDAL